MDAPNQNRVNNLRTVYAKRAVSRFKECIDATRRVETFLGGKVERIALRSARGRGNDYGSATVCEPGGHDSTQDIVTHEITFEQLWDICGRMITYKSRSNGRYARNATKGCARAKGSKDRHGMKEYTAEQAVRKCGQLTHTKRQLGKMCANLLSCERPPEREQLLSDIEALCEREGIRGLPYFLEHPSALETKEQAETYIATLYAMFPMCSRGFKKYFLTPRIKQARKLWGIAKQSSKVETIESITLKYQNLLLG